MRLKRKRRLLLFLPVFMAMGIYVSLLGANYYYAKRAEYLLRRIQDLKLDNSSIAELKRVGSEYGFRYDETPPDKCVDVPCLDYVFTNNQWMHSLLGSPALAKVRRKCRTEIMVRCWRY